MNNSDAGYREAADIALGTRHDAKVTPSTSSTFMVGGQTYAISRVDKVGRYRYMIEQGVASS